VLSSEQVNLVNVSPRVAVLFRYVAGKLNSKGYVMAQEILTANELADRLQLKPGTVRSWAREGRIPALRPTPKVLRFELQRVLEALRKRPAKPEKEANK
jgi:excisionase family DNA binding protein